MAQLSNMSAGRAIQVCNVTSQMNHTVQKAWGLNIGEDGL